MRRAPVIYWSSSEVLEGWFDGVELAGAAIPAVTSSNSQSHRHEFFLTCLVALPGTLVSDAASLLSNAVNICLLYKNTQQKVTKSTRKP